MLVLSFILIAFIFVSKINFSLFLPLPEFIPYLVFQGGLHPYINFLICFASFPIYWHYWQRDSRYALRQSKIYRFGIYALLILLFSLTLLQIQLVHPQQNPWFQFSGFLVAFTLICTFSILIPTSQSTESLLRQIRTWTVALTLISLALYFLGSFGVWRGGRFVGIFKHIPHMVSVATTAFVLYSCDFFLQKKSPSVGRSLFAFLILGSLFFAILLTGTRSSAACAIIALLLAIAFSEGKHSRGMRWLKTASISTAFLATVLFGSVMFDYVYEIATGQASIGEREGQDGVASRLEEIERGWEIFQNEPWLGHGLLYKFMKTSEVSLSGYNSFKDPHNFLVSAGVIGGLPLMFLTVLGYGWILLVSLRSLFSPFRADKTIAIYMLVHFPIMIIYHLHFSLGGIADRLYWLLIGLLSLRNRQ